MNYIYLSAAIIISAFIILLFLKLSWKGIANIILPNHFHVRHEISIGHRQFDEIYSLIKQNTRQDLFNDNDPYEHEQAKRKIENYTVESFKLYVEKNCLTDDKAQFIKNELEHNQVRLDIAKEKGWGFSTQVRQHCIKIIKQVLEENHQGV